MLDISEKGLIFVPVEISNTPALMYLDIGSPFSMLSQQAATRFTLRETALGKGLEITSGNKHVERSTDTDFALGQVSYQQAHFLIDPHSDSPERYSRTEVIGVLGMDLLWKMDLELDLAHRKLNLYEHSHCWNQVFNEAAKYSTVPLQRDAFGNIFFPMELDGRKLEALLTTSSSETTLSVDVTRRVYGFDRDSDDIESVTDEHGHKIAQYRAMKLTTSGLTIADEKIRLTDAPNNNCHLARKGDVIGYTGCLYRYPLRLGSDVLGRLHVYIATQDNLMYYTANAESASH
jgi:Aspartyl protease